jgi:hypothetical protein
MVAFHRSHRLFRLKRMDWRDHPVGAGHTAGQPCYLGNVARFLLTVTLPSATHSSGATGTDGTLAVARRASQPALLAPSRRVSSVRVSPLAIACIRNSVWRNGGL